MRSNTRKLLLLSGSAAPAYLNFTCTTTAPNQTLTLQSIRATGVGITIDWGDGTTTDYASGYTGTHTRTYASASTYTITILCDFNKIFHIDLRDAKITWSITRLPSGLTYLLLIGAGFTGNMSSLPSGLTTLHLSGAGFTGNMSSLPSGLTYLLLNGTGFTGNMSSLPSGLTYLYLSGAGFTGNMSSLPSGLTSLYLIGTGFTGTYNGTTPLPQNATTIELLSGAFVIASGAWTAASKTGARTYKFECNLSSANVDALVAALYESRTSFTGAGALSLDILGGGNAAPGGIYQAAVPPTTGREYIYELINDSAAQGYKKWTTIQYQT